MNEDIKLVQACHGGDVQAFETIVHRYQALVCAITYSAVGRRDVSEELAQETFVQAWKKLGQLKEPGKFRSWLCSIAHSIVCNHLRTQKRSPVVYGEIKDMPADGQEQSPHEALVRQEEEEMIRTALMQIPDEYREPLVLFYRQDQSTRQVAELMGLPEATVRTRLHRGRQMLREQVESKIETTLKKTAPGAAFTRSVMGVVTAGLAAGIAGSTAAGALGTAVGAGGVLTATATKIAIVGAVLIIGAGVMVYSYWNSSAAPVEPTANAVTLPQTEQKKVAAKDSNPKIPVKVDTATIVQTQTITTPQASVEPQPMPAEPKKTVAEPHESYEFKPRGVLSGLITDAKTGKPVTDAEITTSQGGLSKTKTDQNGFYSLDKIDKDGDYSISVYSKEYIGLTDYDTLPKIHLKKTGQAIKHFQFKKACMIDLYVSDEEGKPIKDARVWVTSLADEHGVEIGLSYVSQQTDEKGYILLGGFAPSDKPYVFTALHTIEGDWVEKYGQKYRESVPGLAPGHVKVTLTDPNVIESGEIVLQNGIQLKGTAKYADGTPAKECQIVPYPEWWHCTTCPPGYRIDPNGLFTLSHLAAGTYRILVHIPQGENSSIGKTLFTVNLPAEKEKLSNITVPQKPIENRPSDNKTVEAKLYGLVTDAITSKPIPRFRLRYHKIKGSHYAGETKWTQFNNVNGDFALDMIGSEHAICKVQATTEGYASQWSDTINTENNKAVLIKLTPGGSVTGMVVDAQRNPIANADILPYSLAGDPKIKMEPVFVSQEGVVTTDKAGQFTLKNIAAGIETLKIIHPDYTYTIAPDIRVEEGRQTELGQIILNKGGVIEGVVYDNQGKPQPGVTLYAQNHYGFSSSEIRHAAVITDPNGFYRIEHLPQELCYIVRPRAYQQTGVVSSAVVGQNGKVTRLNFGNGPVIHGQLVIDGKPLTQTRMTLTLGQSSSAGLYRCQAETDDNGLFVLSAGQPGTYTLAYDKKAKYSTSVKLMAIPVDAEDIDLGTIPAAGKTLRVWIELSGQQTDPIQFFYVQENDSCHGEYVFWQDEPKPSETPYIINIPKPGLYYAILRYSGGREYCYPLTIPENQESLDIRLPLQTGSVTITGTLPEQINHVSFTNHDRTISGLLYNEKSKNGAFKVEGLLPGTYYLNPKWAYFDDPITVTIPNVPEYTLSLDSAVLLDKLKERMTVLVFDRNGLPAENAAVWIQRTNRNLLPAATDNYSHTFYLPEGKHIIIAEKDGIKVSKSYQFYVDKNNTGSGESYETFIQLK